MSFTGEVKEDLARVDGPTRSCAVAELSALIKVAGNLSFHDSGSYSLVLATETAAAARAFLRLSHTTFDFQTMLNMRDSAFHRARNRVRRTYVVDVPEQPGLDEALETMGIVSLGRGVTVGVPWNVVKSPAERAAYLRGAFMGAGFVAGPRGDFSLEFVCEGEPLALGIQAILDSVDVHSRINRRRQAFVVYAKSFDDIANLLSFMGASNKTMLLEKVRVVRSLKNDVNRAVNAELANQRRALSAAQDQVELVHRARAELGEGAMPKAIAEFCDLRERYPDLSLAELGAQADPPLSKSAVYHRLLRLKALLAEG